MVKRRRTGTRSWARGIFAFFWIVLAGASGLYLFTLFTDPAALGSQRVQLSAVTGDEVATGTAPAAKPAMPAASSGDAAEVTELKGTIHALTQQVAALDARLTPIEKFIGPVAALPPATSVTTSPPRPPASVQTAPAAAAEPAQEPATAVEDATAEGNVAEAEPTPPAPAPRAEPEPEPEAPAPAAEATPAPETAEPPAVAVAPMEQDDQGEPQNNAAANAPKTPASPTKDVSIAAYDPVELPPAANDGSTRYGIEIGTVGKRDELRPLWREFLTKHAALVAGLQPRCVLAPDKKWRLVAGPFANAQDAEGACTLFKKADRPCSATVFAGDAL